MLSQLTNPNSNRPKRSQAKSRAEKIAERKLKQKSIPQSENSLVYRQLTPAYEMLFPLLVKRRIADTIAALNLGSGEQVLEIGVGTGTSLDAYPRHAKVVGIDLSETMLAVARRKVAERNFDHIQVRTGNAEVLDFPDASIDCVTAFHVVSVVSNPQKMMSEIARVLKPGGKVLIINHFRSRKAWIASVIDRADPVTRHLGWRTDLECESIMQALPFEIQRRYKTSPWSLFTVIRAIRTP